jgi:hypothetical protein
MTDITKAIPVDDDDVLHVSISAHIQTFRYDVTRYLPDGEDGYQDGEPIAWGDNAHSQWLGKGADIRNALIKLCVTHGGQTPTSQYEIVVRLQLERSPGLVEDLTTFRIAPGLATGAYKCLTLQFQ